MTVEKYEPPSLSVLVGRTYRDRIGRYRPRYVGNLRHPVICRGDGYQDYDEKFEDLLFGARDQGIINQEEWDEVWGIHTIVRGEDRENGAVVYAAVDIALTVEAHHIIKAATRGEIMRRITGERTIPAVIGAFLSNDSFRLLALEVGVSLDGASLEDGKLYRYFNEDVLKDIGQGKSEL